MAELQARLAAAGRSLDYIVVSHTEPDHSGLDVYPNATVLASKVALNYLASLTHRDFSQRAVKAGDVVDLGRGHALAFVPAPNLHWPDTMFTHDPASGVMFTCDAFGAHLCSSPPYDSDLGTLSPHFQFYYQCLMLPNARSVTTALRKARSVGLGVAWWGGGLQGRQAGWVLARHMFPFPTPPTWHRIHCRCLTCRTPPSPPGTAPCCGTTSLS